MSDDRAEFYVGYQPEAPPGLARVVRGRVLGIALFALALVPVLVVAQKPFSKAVFEFGIVQRFSGWVHSEPYPTLVVPRPGRTGDAGRLSRYLLVAFGKHGAPEELRSFEGRFVTLEATLVYHEDQTLLEVVDGTVREVTAEELGGAGYEATAEAVVSAWLSEDLGEHTYVGEIVDSKCFLGVMKPGNTKPHRACATRCISGGIPPVLLVRDDEGRASYFLLASADGEAVNAEVLDLVAEPVRITGRVLRYDDLLVLRADPDTYNRVGTSGG